MQKYSFLFGFCYDRNFITGIKHQFLKIDVRFETGRGNLCGKFETEGK